MNGFYFCLIFIHFCFTCLLYTSQRLPLISKWCALFYPNTANILSFRLLNSKLKMVNALVSEIVVVYFHDIEHVSKLLMFLIFAAIFSQLCFSYVSPESKIKYKSKRNRKVKLQNGVHFEIWNEKEILFLSDGTFGGNNMKLTKFLI